MAVQSEIRSLNQPRLGPGSTVPVARSGAHVDPDDCEVLLRGQGVAAFASAGPGLRAATASLPPRSGRTYRRNLTRPP
jgi:hypothetical protein